MSGENGGAIWAGGVDSAVSCSGATALGNKFAPNVGAMSIEERGGRVFQRRYLVPLHKTLPAQ